MSETTDLVDVASDATPSTGGAADAGAARSRRRGSGLSGMLLPELQRLAGELGIPGTARMRKSDLIAAISERQVSGTAGTTAPSVPTPRTDRAPDAGTAPLEAPVSGGGNSAPVTAPSTGTDTPADAAPSKGSARADESAPANESAPVNGSTPEASGSTPEVGVRRRRTASRPAGAPAAAPTDAAAADTAPAAPAA
ncbi:Rho termination factor N-terminal domain-containing protein, partial [Modestobacter lapidis]